MKFSEQADYIGHVLVKLWLEAVVRRCSVKPQASDTFLYRIPLVAASI